MVSVVAIPRKARRFMIWTLAGTAAGIFLGMGIGVALQDTIWWQGKQAISPALFILLFGLAGAIAGSTQAVVNALDRTRKPSGL
jgi:hypothetical protein